MGADDRRDTVIGVGFACVDHLIAWRSVRESVADNAVVQYDMQGGGMTATGMVAVARLGGRAEFWGAAGEGPMGDFLVSGLEGEGVDISQVVRVPGQDGPVYLVCVDAGTGDRLFYRGKGIAAPTDPFGDLSRVARAGSVLVDGGHLATAVNVVERARAMGVPVVGDVGETDGSMSHLLGLLDYAIASEMCAQGLGVGEDYEAACRALHDMGARTAVVTLGERGLIAFDGRRCIRKPAYDVDVLDTTGAGDTFHGAFCLGLVRGLSLEANLAFASATAAIACTRLGGRAGLPSLDQVGAFLAQREPSFDLTQIMDR